MDNAGCMEQQVRRKTPHWVLTTPLQTASSRDSTRQVDYQITRPYFSSMPARNSTKKKNTKSKRPNVAKPRIPRPVANRGSKLTMGSLRRMLPSAVTNYFDFLDGKGADPCARIPARSSRITTPYTALYRFTVNTDLNSSAQILVNTQYTPDGCIVKLPTTLAGQYAAVSYGTLIDSAPIQPYTYDAGSNLTTPVNPLVPTYRTIPAVDTKGNKPGLQRLRGLRMTIVPRGTQLNAGGEVFVLHSPYTNNVAGMSSNDIFAHPDTRRFSIAANRPVTYAGGPLRKRHEFIEIREFANSDNSGYPVSASGDIDVFGDGHSGLTGGTHYASDGYKGWDMGVVIKSAVTAQIYEIQLQVYFDLLRTQPSSELSATENGLPVVSPTDVVPANQHMVDLMDTAHASQVLTRVHSMGSPAQSFSIWPHVEAAARAIMPHLIDAGAGFLAAGL